MAVPGASLQQPNRAMARRVPLLLILLMIAWSSPSEAAVLNPSNGHYYDVVLGAIPWSAARDAAAAQTLLGVPGHLATIADGAEDGWIVSTFNPSPGLDNVWIGGFQNLNSPSYSEPAGGWEWVTGEPMGYTNWSSGEPNGGPDSDYMEIKSGASPPWSWNDVQGGEPNNRGYIVEFDVTSGPAPPTPSSCDATDNLSGGVAITWSDVPGEAGYLIFRGSTQIATRGANVTSFTDIPPAGTYQYCVQAFNGSGTSSPCCDSGTKLLAPPLAPSPCSASDNSPNNVTITWTDVLDEQQYIILRNGAQVGTAPANATSFIDGPPPGTYTYCVFGANTAGGGSQCCDSGRRLPPPPPAPLFCSASDNLTTGVVFSWDDVTGEDGYRIFRNASLIGTVGPNILSFTDNLIPQGATFQYCVTAYNVTGQSSTCCDMGTRTFPPPPPSAPGMDVTRLGLLLSLLGVAGAVALRRRV
jgi:hypothetical protein